MLGTRRTRAALALGVLLLLSGCTGLLGGGLGEERLNRTPPGGDYEWNASADVHVTIHENTTFEGVYRAEGSKIELYRRDGFGGRNPLSASAIRYQYPNGTAINGSELADRARVERTREAVIIEYPNGDVAGDEIAFTATSSPKRFALPTFVKGDYEILLPPGREISLPVFGRVSPPADTFSEPDAQNRVHVTVNDVKTDSVIVQFYLPRDLRILAVILTIASVIAGGGVAYYLRQIEQLRKRREEMGLDVDTEDDDFGRDPPPGMG
ncbi:MAG: DUF5803 family protein [Halobaculum sp.]